MQKKNLPEKQFIEAANLIVKSFKTPAALLEFTRMSLNWIDGYHARVKDPMSRIDNFFQTQMIDRIIQPWFVGNDIINNIALGIKEIHDFEGATEWYNNTASIVKAMGADMPEAIMFQKSVESYMSSILTLFKVHYCLADYEDEQREIKEKAKIKQAA